jgi:exonuclease SbcC
MRLHRLRITAFGPFAGEEEVDVDALNDGGLFLLHGPTGAGKTSVLDAICFALYGRVPGERGGNRLRSDHAPADRAPEVSCEFSVGSRRLGITRSPAWERPKKKGAGTTTQQARVTVSEVTHGAPVVLTTRIDEAARLIEDVLGLGLEQFTKLVLLPQGQFAAFLRADAEDRRALLERLFDTDRFATVQAWLRERQNTARREVEKIERDTDRLRERAREAVAVLPAPPEREEADPGADDQPDRTEPLAEVRALAEHARSVAEEARARRSRTRAALEAASAERERVSALADRQRNHAELLGRRRILDGNAAEVDRARKLLQESRRAAAFGSVASGLRGSRSRLDETLAAFTRAVHGLGTWSPPGPWPELTESAVPPDLPEHPDETLTVARTQEWLAAAHAEQEFLEAAGPRLDTLITEIRRSTELDRELGRLREEAERAEQAYLSSSARAEQATGRREQLEHDLAETGQIAATVDRLRTEREAAQQILDAVGHRQELLGARSSARERLTRMQDEHQDLRHRWLEIRERRLDGIAAELATTLVAGGACPVCGSTAHPGPAVPGDGPRVDEEVEIRARSAVERAESRRETAAQELTGIEVELAAATVAAHGHDRPEAERLLDEARDRLVEAERSTQRVADLSARRDQLDDEIATATRSLATSQERRREARDALSTAVGAAQTVREGLDALTVGLPRDIHRDPEAMSRLSAQLRSRSAAWTTAIDTGRSLVTAIELHDESIRQAASAAARAGFADPESALAAIREPSELQELEELTRRADEERAAVTDRLADPDLQAAAHLPPADPDAAERDERDARARDGDAAEMETRSTTARDAAERIAENLATHLNDSAPVLDRARELTELSRCADGTGGDNALRMSLSAYVLAARLEQVAEAAGIRLSSMSGGRYTVVHSDARESGRGRSGLSLRMVDGWTGVERSTRTLSGGESFYTSLALALGLADVVTAEAGGSVVETLFVDEGFGSLDEETLDEVMDVLDELRAGGRVVGLVSHVADLRNRIPTQLEVLKSRTGSRLRQVTG